MPITKSAKKALRGSQKKRVFNDKRKNDMKEILKKTEAVIKAGKKDEALKMLPLVYKAIDKAWKRGVIKKNTAGRKKSRLVKRIGK